MDSPKNNCSAQDDFEITLSIPGETGTLPAPVPAETSSSPEDDFEITLETPVLTPVEFSASPAENDRDKEKTIVPAAEKSDVEIPLQISDADDIPELPQELFAEPEMPRRNPFWGRLILLLFLLAAAGGGYYIWCNYRMEIRAAMVSLELKMNFRLFKSEVKKLSRDEINAGDAKRRTEIHKTAGEGDLPRLEQLISAGGNINLLDIDKNSVFHFAAKGGNTRMMAFLRKKSPKMLHSPNAAGETPLHIAAKYNRFAMVEFLITHRANVRALTADGKSAWELSSSPEVRKILQQADGRRR